MSTRIPRRLSDLIDKLLEQELAPAFPYSFPAHMHGVSTTDQLQAVIDHYTSPTRQVVRKVVAASQTFELVFSEVPKEEKETSDRKVPTITVQANTGKVVIRKTFEVGAGAVIKIGSIPTCHIQIEDQSVSHIHAVIDVKPDGRMDITDLGSYHGTFVGGEKVTKKEITFDSVVRVGVIYLKISPGEVCSTDRKPEVAVSWSGYIVRDASDQGGYVGPNSWVDERELAMVFPTLEEANKIAAEAKRYSESSPVVEVANVPREHDVSFYIFNPNNQTYWGTSKKWVSVRDIAKIYDAFAAADDVCSRMHSEVLVVACRKEYVVVNTVLDVPPAFPGPALDVAHEVTYTNRVDAQAHIDRMDHPENFKIVVRLK